MSQSVISSKCLFRLPYHACPSVSAAQDHSFDQMCCTGVPTLIVIQALEDGDEAVNHNFIRQALQPIVSMLLEQLTKQEPGQDRDEGIWNLSMAAGTCLGLVANCVRDEIVGLVMPYVQVCCLLPQSANFISLLDMFL